jgi:small ligand-binding sensory domain FIST
MLRAGVGVSTDPDPRIAAEQAVQRAVTRIGRAEAALLFATTAHRPGMAELLDTAMAGLGTRAVVGATAHGVIGAGLEHEGGAAVSVLALSGLEAHPFLLAELAHDAAGVGEEIASRLGGAARPQDLVVLLPDPRAFRSGAFLDGVREALGPARIVGAGAADPLSDQPLQWCGSEIESGALAGIALRAARVPRVGVTQACRPATELLTVTRAERHWVLELEGRPALDVYREAARGPLADDLRRAAAFVLVALPRDPSAPLEPGGYLVRNVAGFATERRAFALPEPLARGERIAFLQREPETAREDLKRVLEQLRGGQPALGLYFDCCARGASFFGIPGLEAAYLQNALGDVPLAGMFGSCEIGPIAGRAELLTYTGVIALLDA